MNQPGLPIIGEKLMRDLLYCMSWETLDFSIRTTNCLRSARYDADPFMGRAVQTIGDVARMTDDELLLLEHFGRKSLRELRALVPFDSAAPRFLSVQSLDPPLFEFWR